jgi:hypothetical protein
VALLLLVPVLALAGAGPAAADETLGAIPEQCTGENYEFGDCLVATRLGALTLSPHVVHAGGTITGTVALTGPYPVSWPTAIPFLIEQSSCVGKASCTWKVPANAPTVKYTTLAVGVTNNQGLGISRDYYAIIGKDRFDLAGHIKDAEGKGVAGVTVQIAGTEKASAVTDATGQYNELLKRGSYTVTPRPGRGQVFDPGQSSVVLNQDRTVDFRLRPNVDEVTVTPEAGTVAASGLGTTGITITDRNSSGEPVEGAAINVEPPLDYSLPALICNSANRLVYPTLLNDGSALGAKFTAVTDGSGEIHLSAFFGAVPGDWLIEAGESSAPLSRYGHAEVALSPSGGAAKLPDALTSLLIAAGNKTLANFTQEPQRRVLEWLGQIRGEIGGVAFLPIRSIDPAGFRESGVVVYADTGAVREAVMDYLTGRSTFPPSEEQAVVIDTKSLVQLQFGEVVSGQRATTTPFRLPGLADWANGTTIKITEKAQIPIPARGRPQFGLENPKAGDELLYGYGPYPPFGGPPATQAIFQQCVSPSFQTTITPHSPVTVEVRDAAGQETGLGAGGAAQDAIPGSLVSHAGAALKLVSVPAGAYTVTVRGTGAGPATLVFSVPSASGTSTRVFHFQARRGASGRLQVSATGAGSTLRIGGRTVRATAGLALTVHGLPAALSKGRTSHLAISLREQLGHGAGPVSVRVSGVAGSLSASSTDSGRLHLTLRPARRGTIRLSFSGPGFASLTRTIRVR